MYIYILFDDERGPARQKKKWRECIDINVYTHIHYVLICNKCKFSNLNDSLRLLDVFNDILFYSYLLYIK